MDNSASPHIPLSDREHTGELREVRIDPAASAALAEAIRSARQELKPLPHAEPSARPGAPAHTSKRGFKGSLLSQAATALLLIGAGWFAFSLGTLANRDSIRRMEAETARSQEMLSKLTDDLAALKSTVAAARDVERTASTASAADQAGKIAATVERLAAAVQEPAKRIASLEDRLGRMESQIMERLNAAPSATPAPAAPAPAAAAEADSPPLIKSVRTDPVEGWVLREVYNGSALVESRNRGLYEVMPGNIIPGVGRVEAIERRGARWVVVTDKGFIGTYR
ncbi:MAG TPA: hypothetical protein VEZ24_02015 [Microvirga sp.]|nr:hypothetical protein [Microvirga sp.]